MSAVNLGAKLATFSEHWQPRTVSHGGCRHGGKEPGHLTRRTSAACAGNCAGPGGIVLQQTGSAASRDEAAAPTSSGTGDSKMTPLPLIKGMLTFIPGVAALLPNRPGHTGSGAYCYNVWMKHMTLLHAHGLPAVPDTVAELGPGESLGVGLAALLSGANHYVGLDVSPNINTTENLRILDELTALFAQRAPRPEKGWPDFDEHLDAGLFPGHILTAELLSRTLHPARIERIRKALMGKPDSAKPDSDTAITIEYRAPWSDPAVIAPDSVDLIMSHSVLEHVVDLPDTYAALYAWLKPGGWMSHQIDFKSHGLSKAWNGYRAYSTLTWKLMMGKRLFMINQAPRSVHQQLLRAAGFRVVSELEYHRDDGIQRAQLAQRWSDISDEDLSCSGLFVVARK